MPPPSSLLSRKATTTTECSGGDDSALTLSRPSSLSRTAAINTNSHSKSPSWEGWNSNIKKFGLELQAPLCTTSIGRDKKYRNTRISHSTWTVVQTDRYFRIKERCGWCEHYTWWSDSENTIFYQWWWWKSFVVVVIIIVLDKSKGMVHIHTLRSIHNFRTIRGRCT